MLPRMHASPVPMKMTSGFDSATATAPTDALVIWLSVMAAQVVPPSVVFHRPPPVAPKYPTFGCPRTPVTVRERPPRSGPTLRQRYALRMAESTGGAMGAERTIPAPAEAASGAD